MSSEKSSVIVSTCWTKFKGGKFALESGKIWKEYDKEDTVIGTFEQLESDDYGLHPYQKLLVDRKTDTLIKLDKTWSRKSQIPSDEDDLAILELFRLKWNVIEKGFWDTFKDENKENN
eukprot:7030_1